MLQTGCSVPVGGQNSELLFGYLENSEDGLRSRRVAPGLDVRIRTAHSGVSLGLSAQDVLLPERPVDVDSQEGPTASRGVHFEKPFGIGWIDGGRTKRIGWIFHRSVPEVVDPRFVRVVQVGFGAGGAGGRFNAILGYSNETLTVVGRETDGVYRLRYLSEDFENSRLIKTSD